MIDDLTNLGVLKLRLLAEGVEFDRTVMAAEESYLSKRYYFGKSDHVAVAENVRPPQEILLGEGSVVVGVNQRPNAPWRISRTSSGLYPLDFRCERVGFVRFATKPNFYGKPLASEEAAESVLSLYGTYVLAAFVKGQCYLFGQKVQCQFCSLNPTRKELHDGVMRIQADPIAQAAELAFQHDADRIACVMYCGGSIPDRDQEIRDYIKLIRSVNSVKASHKVHHHILTMPPKSFELFDEVLEAGVDDLGMSLEVYDPDLFKTICPGKARFVGHDGYFRAFEAAVKTFGRGRVYCVFVGGMEEQRTMFEGFDILSSMGVIPSVNIFHPDPQAVMRDRRPPDIDYLYETAQYLGRIYRKYDFVPAVCGFNRNSLDAEGAAGFFEPGEAPRQSMLGRRPGRQRMREPKAGPAGFFKPVGAFPQVAL